jgi:hypothetical protein
MALEVIPLCEIDVTLKEPVFIGEGPSGLRVVFEVDEATVTGDRLRGKAKGSAFADWARVSGTIATIDVRGTFETDDGAVVFVSYEGRNDVTNGPGAAPVYVAPKFETGDERYLWLNAIQAVGKGELVGSTLHYEWYEVR